MSNNNNNNNNGNKNYNNNNNEIEKMNQKTNGSCNDGSCNDGSMKKGAAQGQQGKPMQGQQGSEKNQKDSQKTTSDNDEIKKYSINQEVDEGLESSDEEDVRSNEKMKNNGSW